MAFFTGKAAAWTSDIAGDKKIYLKNQKINEKTLQKVKRRRNVTIAASTNCESKTAEIEVSVMDKLTAGLDVTQEGTVYGGTALKAPSYHISGGTEAPGSTETPDAGKKPAAKGTVLVDAGKTATYVVTSADAKHPTIAYKKCRNKKGKDRHDP